MSLRTFSLYFCKWALLKGGQKRGTSLQWHTRSLERSRFFILFAPIDAAVSFCPHTHIHQNELIGLPDRQQQQPKKKIENKESKRRRKRKRIGGKRRRDTLVILPAVEQASRCTAQPFVHNCRLCVCDWLAGWLLFFFHFFLALFFLCEHSQAEWMNEWKWKGMRKLIDRWRKKEKESQQNQNQNQSRRPRPPLPPSPLH